MTIKKQYIESKPDVISNFAIHATDPGSSAVQIALLTKKI